ncbi:NlpC/P60 family protein [Candidatus Dependentiae bacterium]|nr:NlpC/P60 family protein [Candidatus Dependentiae bacterium]
MNYKIFPSGFFIGFVALVYVNAYAKSRRGVNHKAIVGTLVAEAYYKLPPSLPLLEHKTDPLLSSAAPGLDTQVLLGDRLKVIKSNIKHEGTKWVEVKLLDQLTFKNNSWVAKTCFINSNDCFTGKLATNWRSNAIVTSLVASVFVKPGIDSLQLGRLSLGTRVKTKKEIAHGWTEVILASGLTGCVRSSDIVTDDALNRWSISIKRDQVVRVAKNFQDSPYRWGCASGFDSNSRALTGVDCSGLCYLAYRTIGLQIPRDSHDQFLASSPIKFGGDLKAGDLIFIARIDTDKKIVKVHQVMMVIGKDLLIESTGLGVSNIKDLSNPKEACTRLVSSFQHPHIKKSLKDLWHGQINEHNQLIFLGTFLGDKAVYSKLSKSFLR